MKVKATYGTDTGLYIQTLLGYYQVYIELFGDEELSRFLEDQLKRHSSIFSIERTRFRPTSGNNKGKRIYIAKAFITLDGKKRDFTCCLKRVKKSDIVEGIL